MNFSNMSKYTLKGVQKTYFKVFGSSVNLPWCEKDPDIASDIVYEKLMQEGACMIARLGSTELSTVVNYLGVKGRNKSVLKYIRGEVPSWWWEQNLIEQMQNWSGFFPPTYEKIERFCELMLHNIPKVDVLGSWLAQENYFSRELINAKKIRLLLLDPFWAKKPWTRSLKDKKVLVVHPFAELMEKQYSLKREALFENSDILPKFELKTIKAVQSLGGDNNGFADWFEALDYMKGQIDSTDFDVCLIGCGAYGFPLAAHVKNIGKKAVHLGGSLQLLFGIIGKRWEDPDYGRVTRNYCQNLNYPGLINENWIRPTNMKIKNSDKVENSCYW